MRHDWHASGLVLSTLAAAAGLATSASAGFVRYSVVATNVTNSGQNLVRYEVFAVFDGPTDTALNVYNLQVVSVVGGGDGYAGIWHKDNNDSSPGTLTQEFGTWAPQLIGSATANRPFDSFLSIGATVGSTSSATADPSWTSGGSGSHAGGPAGWNRPDLVNNGTIGWFNSSPPNLQGRVGVNGNSATEVKIGQFVLSQGQPLRTYSLRIAWNTASVSAPLSTTAQFTIGASAPTWYRDLDGDGFGSAASGTVSQVSQPAGYVANDADCDDSNPAINPNTVWFRDADGDGFGAAASGTLVQCLQPSGHVLAGTDCDDANPAINPSTVWFRDVDGDGYGFAGDGTAVQCAQPAGYALVGGDNCPSIANPTQGDCNSNGTGDACEIAAGTLFDCDSDGVPDTCEGAVRVDSTSPLLAPFGNGFPVSHAFTGLPRAYRGVPTLTILATSDLNTSSEFIAVSIEGGAQEFFFVGSGSDCPATPDVATRTFALPAFNALVGDGTLSVSVVASGTVDANQCAGGGLRLRLQFDGVPASADCNGNLVLDSCEIGSGTQGDCDADGVLDSCEIAAGAPDCNANGRPDACDLASGTSTDINASGVPDECEYVVGGSGFGSIGAAIAAVPPGATIEVGPGTHAGPISIATKPVTLRSIAGAASTILSGSGITESILAVRTAAANGTVVDGFTFRDGTSGTAAFGTRVGGAIHLDGTSAAVRNCRFLANSAPFGGAIYGYRFSGVVEGCHFEGNSAGSDGGAAQFGFGGTWSCLTSTFVDNAAGRDGGAIHVVSWTDGPVTSGAVEDCAFIENAAGGRGGALSFFGGAGGNLPIRRCTVERNASAAGGGMSAFGGPLALAIEDSRFCINLPVNVSGAYLDLGGNVFAVDCNANGICDADDVASGAAADCDGNGLLDLCEIAGDVAAWGDGSLGQTALPSNLGPVLAIAAGCNHGLAVRTDGSVVAWGHNAKGQCNVPAGLSGVVDVAAGCDFSIALRANGTVVCWGDNDFGQCVVPAGLSNVVQVVAGGDHAIARTASGGLVAWGRNVNGEATVPAGLGGVVDVACGGAHSVAVRANGTVVAWGLNNFGQANVPTGLAGVAKVAAGCYHTMALLADGTVRCFGSNLFGQSAVPAGLSGVVAIAAGVGQHSVALRADGAVFAWGWNAFGQSTPPAGLAPASEIAAGGVHTFVRTRGAPDCNANGILDACDVAAGGGADCDDDGALDACEIAVDPTLDCDGDGILNSCELNGGGTDCNGNGLPDTCDLASGTSTDIDGSGLPDECEFVVGGSGYQTISAAIAAAPAGQTILVGPGTYAGVHFVLHDKPIVLRSIGGAGATVIDGSANVLPIATVMGPATNGTVIDGFTFANAGTGTGMQGIDGGAAIGMTNTNAVVLDCVFVGNLVDFYGGAIFATGFSGRIERCRFEENEAWYGGALLIEDSVGWEVDDCEFIANRASSEGGAVRCGPGVGTFRDCTFVENWASTSGGAIVVNGTTGLRSIVGCTIDRNVAYYAGGISSYAEPESLVITGSRLCSNLTSNVVGPFTDGGGNLFSQDCDANGECDADEIAAGDAVDCDGNGIPDSCDVAGGSALDCNENGVPDSCDVASGASADVDSNGVPDECKPDCDGDGLPDAWEILQGLATDCDANGLPDNCDVAADPSLDCNLDGTIDACGIADGTDVDCDASGVPDACEIADDPARDCDASGALDACEIASGSADDCNANGVPDACDLDGGANDANGNGIPDDCDRALGDLDLDGFVSASDLAILMSFWGWTDPPLGDLNGDGAVNAEDLAELVSNWGALG